MLTLLRQIATSTGYEARNPRTRRRVGAYNIVHLVQSLITRTKRRYPFIEIELTVAMCRRFAFLVRPRENLALQLG